MADRYGNLPLGQAYKLLIAIIGRDAALATAEELDENGEKPLATTGKDLDRLFNEKDRRFAHLRPSEKTSPMELFRHFSAFLEWKYSFPKAAMDFIQFFSCGVFRDAIRGNGTDPLGNDTFKLKEGGLLPYEMPTSKLSLLLLNWSLQSLGLKDKSHVAMVSKEKVLQLLHDSYETLFGKVYRSLGTSKSQFCKDTEEFYKWEKLDDFEQALMRAVTKCCKNNTNDPWIGEKGNWYKFRAILDNIDSKGEKECVHRLIGLYLLKNIETALKEICGIEQRDIYRVKQDILKWAEGNLPASPQSESQCFLMTVGKNDPTDLSTLQKHFITPYFEKQRIAIYDCTDYLWGIGAIHPEKAEHLIQTMEKECPHCGVFFGTWARARLAVLSCKFEDSEDDIKKQSEALRCYHIAFSEGRNFAGASLKAFLEESIAATVYFNRRETKDIPKVIDTDKSLQTPITDDVKESEKRDASYGAKQYYEYGYALNMFEHESSESYFLHFHAEEHFWNVFHASSFIHAEFAKQKYSQDMLKAKGFYVYNVDFNNPKEVEEWKESNNHTKKLWAITEKKINKRMEIQHGHKIQYTPLSVAFRTCQLDIAEHYLEKFVDTLDVSIINTHGSTALSEALMRYKLYRFGGKNQQEAGRIKKIIMELIRRSPADALYAETVKSRISVLEEAINSFDVEIVKRIVEAKGFDIQDLKISADELSPLYYAVLRLYFVEHAISKGHIPNGDNITWKNLNVPGVFAEDKQLFMEQMKNDPAYKEIGPSCTAQFIGDSSIWKQEFEEIKTIVKYLIDKTDNVDAFVKQIVNVLGLAIEHDFEDICRLLIEKGADPARIFVDNTTPYDSPIHRAIYYKSWRTLEMLLTDFKKNIKPIINQCYMEDKHTAMHLLFRIDYGAIYQQYSINHENFKSIEQFIPMFRNAGAEFDIPDARNITVRQILKERNCEYLIGSL